MFQLSNLPMVPVVAFHKNYPDYALPNICEILDNDEDRPKIECPGTGRLGPLGIPSLIFGGATLSHHYNDLSTFLKSDVPFRVVRLALRYGITAFDTSPYYGSSEIVLGQILSALRPEFPRSSYMLMTKCGRYGLDKDDFDYSPETIRQSITRSLDRLNTDYLDVVYLHDVEFVASPIYPENRSCKPGDILDQNPNHWGLGSDTSAAQIGDGDQIILDALRELFKLKEEGKVKAVGITGYALPILLRLATLAFNQHIGPLDVVLSFCHLTLQNSSLLDYLPLFMEKGRVSQIISASPLSMGLLTSNPPEWHPAPKVVRQLSKKADTICGKEGLTLAAVALHYGLHVTLKKPTFHSIPVVLGLSKLDEVHEAMQLLCSKTADEKKYLFLEETVKCLYREIGYDEWSWASPL